MADTVLSAREMQAVERAAFDDGIDAESLMDCAGEGIANAVLEREPHPGICVAYLGKGNNAGDAIVAGSLLAKAGWEIRTRSLAPESDLQGLPRKKWRDLQARVVADPITDLPKNRPRAILDGLLGLGSRSGLNAPLKALTRELNALRLESNTNVYAVDLPTGLGVESIDPDAVVADFTLTIGFPKAALFRDDAPNFVGHIVVIDLAELTSRGPKELDRTMLSSAESLRKFVPRRLFDSHKGDFGRVGIVAGSRGLVGASILCSEAAARAGAGLISLYVPEEIYDLVVCKVTPEIMVKPRTLIGQSGKPMAYNTTGSPGLATGGSGDVLTGVCAAFLARKIPVYDAGRLGAWLCGRAAEVAVKHSSEESMLPSDLFSYLGSAFSELRNGLA